MNNKMHNALKIPFLTKLEDTAKKMNTTELIIAILLASLMFIGAIGMLANLDNYVSTYIPTSGGSFTEGIIGTPRFINPLLAITDSDRDLVELTFSGLMRANTTGGLVPDIAKSYTISDDGKEYTFKLKEDLKFHDGTALTADDIIFTINSIQDSNLKSPRRADWDGVKVTKVNNYEVKFELPKPFVPFLENTTLGIIPKHLWQNVKIEEFSFSKLNNNPIGSGPYKVYKIDYDKSGIPINYRLKAFKDYSLGTPFIKEITLKFFNDKEEALSALIDNTVDAASGVSIKDTKDLNNRSKNINQATYPRIFAVFFNQDKASIFASKSVREALDLSVNKQQIIDTVLDGHATVLESAIPGAMLEEKNTKTKQISNEERLAEAKKILEKNGWKFEQEQKDEDDEDKNNTPKLWRKDSKVLSFRLATANTPELKEVANALIDFWNKLGIKVELDTYDANELNQNVIRTRDYDALLFGEVLGRSLDLFAFWHSSQRDDPGLNIALYANAKLDKLLKKARTELDTKERVKIHQQINEIMIDDTPAVFLYTPDFVYILPEKIKGVNLKLISMRSERFSEVYKWYIETTRVWNIFTK